MSKILAGEIQLVGGEVGPTYEVVTLPCTYKLWLVIPAPRRFPDRLSIYIRACRYTGVHKLNKFKLSLNSATLT